MPIPWAVFATLALAGPPPAAPSPDAARPDFLTVVSLRRPAAPPADVWKVASPPAAFAWMTASGPFPMDADSIAIGSANSFQQLLERVGPTDERSPAPVSAQGLIIDPGWWRYKLERSGGIYTRRTKLDLPDPNEMLIPYAARNWTAQESLRIPVPIPLPVAEQLFVYGQLYGSGDPLRNQAMSLSGKTGVGLKWSLLAKSELQVRYATLFSYADVATLGRFQERALPAVEVMARVPILGPLEVEYTGSAIPAVARTDIDQIRQELRLALPLRGDNELEFGARYRWEYDTTPTPWMDRAQLFLGVKMRH